MNEMSFKTINKFKENIKESEIVEKTRRYFLIATLAITTFLQSCGDGAKKPASEEELRELKNKIENSSNYEKISPELIKSIIYLYEQNKDNSSIAHLSLINEEEGKEKTRDYFPNLINYNSTLSVTGEIGQVYNKNGEPASWSGKGITIKLNTDCNIITQYTENHLVNDDFEYSDTGFRAVTDKMYIVTSDGSVEQKGYVKGDATKVLEKLICAKSDSTGL